jgi:hypothetical protein
MALKDGQSAITIYISTELMLRLKAQAAADGRSLSNFVARRLETESHVKINPSPKELDYSPEFDQTPRY